MKCHAVEGRAFFRLGALLLNLPIPGAVPLFEGDGLSSKYTVISRKVVEKSPCDNTEGYCGWFGVHCPPKKFARMVTIETMDLCL